MAEPSGQENGGGNRATVALVYHAVAEVKELTRAGFADVQRQLDALQGIPERVARLEERASDLEDAGRYRRVHLPSLVLAAAAVVIAAARYFT